MAGEPTTTLVGNLTADPELRFTPSGAAVASFTVACTPRRKDGDQWVDGETMFVRCSAWRQLAENVAGSLVKGQQVVVLGRLGVQRYEAKDGSGTRESVVLEVDEVGPSLRFGTAAFTRDGAGGNRQQQNRPNPTRARPAPSTDPWAASSADEPPF